jgi:hypothetical protein
MPARNVTPVSNPLPGPKKKREDGFVPPGNCGIDKLWRQARVELFGDFPGYSSAELPGSPAKRQIATLKAVATICINKRGGGRIGPLEPCSAASLIVLPDSVSEVRRQQAEAMVYSPRRPPSIGNVLLIRPLGLA